MVIQTDMDNFSIDDYLLRERDEIQITQEMGRKELSFKTFNFMQFYEKVHHNSTY